MGERDSGVDRALRRLVELHEWSIQLNRGPIAARLALGLLVYLLGMRGMWAAVAVVLVVVIGLTLVARRARRHVGLPAAQRHPRP